jgi:hypothetical protein
MLVACIKCRLSAACLLLRINNFHSFTLDKPDTRHTGLGVNQINQAGPEII